MLLTISTSSFALIAVGVMLFYDLCVWLYFRHKKRNKSLSTHEIRMRKHNTTDYEKLSKEASYNQRVISAIKETDSPTSIQTREERNKELLNLLYNDSLPTGAIDEGAGKGEERMMGEAAPAPPQVTNPAEAEHGEESAGGDEKKECFDPMPYNVHCDEDAELTADQPHSAKPSKAEEHSYESIIDTIDISQYTMAGYIPELLDDIYDGIPEENSPLDDSLKDLWEASQETDDWGNEQSEGAPEADRTSDPAEPDLDEPAPITMDEPWDISPPEPDFDEEDTFVNANNDVSLPSERMEKVEMETTSNTPPTENEWTNSPSDNAIPPTDEGEGKKAKRVDFSQKFKTMTFASFEEYAKKK